ncbi:unnamed protein product [Parnassius mnemosyne]|uniref:Tyr recombinase domain-containing protein n=1 Tax=Parnassius mnemosyne TaxID=213953 RepID=A0AAV1LPZ7_9NEOP
MLNSLSGNTMKQYDSTLRLWWEYCRTLDIDPYQASVPFILKFLSERFDAGASYGTLNAARSALSLLIGPKVGCDDRLKRFFKGVFRLKPPKPKYNVTWDPGLVLDYLALQYPNESIDIELLTKKLVTILALTTGHRVQTLSHIKLQNIKINSSGVQIKIPDLIKTSNKNILQPILHLKIYTCKLEICPVNTLKSYIRRTEQFRHNTEQLLLTIKKPYRAASSQTLSRWIKSTLSKAGIDMSIFTAHSTRHAATSAANRAGLSMDLIRKTAGWSKNSETFARFYNRPLSEDPLLFRSTVCNTSHVN